MMRIGICMCTYVYAPGRRPLVERTCNSLLLTQQPSEKPRLLIVEKMTDFQCPDFSKVFDYEHCVDPEGVTGPDTPLVWGSERLFLDGCDYVVWLNDDGVFNPEWLIQLEALIYRHPAARGWSVYHSGHTEVHQELETVGDDVRVKSLCGHGTTMSKEEFKEWGVSSVQRSWGSPYGCTVDLYHFWMRPGERWVTAKSYMDHTGKMIGIHCTGVQPEYAQNFVGE